MASTKAERDSERLDRYQAPAVRRLGTLAELTLTGGNITADGPNSSGDNGSHSGI